MSEMMDYAGALAEEIGPRPVNSEEERQSAQKVAGWFDEKEVPTDIEEFQCPTWTTWPNVACYLLMALAALLSFANAAKIPMLIIALLALGVFIYERYVGDYFSTRIKRGLSQNVVARYIPKSLEGERRTRKIVIVAHYDTERASLEASPKVVDQYPIIQNVILVCMILIPVLIILQMATIKTSVSMWFWLLSVFAAIAPIIAAFCILIRQFVMRYPDGANNNASGIAVMMNVFNRVVGKGQQASPAKAKGQEEEQKSAQPDESGKQGVPAGEQRQRPVVHDERTARKAGLVPQGATITYDAGTGEEEEAEVPPEEHRRVRASSTGPVHTMGSQNPAERRGTSSEAEQAEASDDEHEMTSAEALAEYEKYSGIRHIGQPVTSPSTPVTPAPSNQEIQQAAPTTNSGTSAVHRHSEEEDAAKRVAQQAVVSDADRQQPGEAPSWWQRAESKRKSGFDIDGVEDLVKARSRYADIPDTSYRRPETEQALAEERAAAEAAAAATAAAAAKAAEDEAAAAEAKAEPKAEVEAGKEAPEDARGTEFGDEAGQEQSAEAAQPSEGLGETVQMPAVSKMESQVPEIEEQHQPVEKVGAGHAAGRWSHDDQQGYGDQQPYDEQQDYAGQQAYDGQGAYDEQQSYGDQQGYDEQQGYGDQQGYDGSGAYGAQQSYDSSAYGDLQAKPRVPTVDDENPFAGLDYSADGTPVDPRAQREGARRSHPFAAPQAAPVSSHYENTPQSSKYAGKFSNIPDIDLSEYGEESGEINLPGKSLDSGEFSPLSAGSFAAGETGAFIPVGNTDSFAAIVNEDPDIFVADADDSSLRMPTVGDFDAPSTIAIPESRAHHFMDNVSDLFSHKKDGKKDRRNRNETSASEWLGVDKDYNAREEGRNIGSWANFEDDDFQNGDSYDNWKGGAAAYQGQQPMPQGQRPQQMPQMQRPRQMPQGQRPQQTPQGQRPQQAQQGQRRGPNNDELRAKASDRMKSGQRLDKEVWFVALGAHGAGNAGMKDFLARHASELTGATIINLDCVGAGEICYLEREGLGRSYVSDRRLQAMCAKIADQLGAVVEMERLDWASTDVTPALKAGYRAITIMGFDKKAPVAWNQKSDNCDILEMSRLQLTSDLVTEMVRNG